MKLICLSDTQADTNTILSSLQIISPFLEKADIIVHLGDGVKEAQPALDKYSEKVVYIKGNHDRIHALREYQRDFQGLRFIFTHGDGNPWLEQLDIWMNQLRKQLGHSPNLEGFYDRLYQQYQDQCAVLVYGHTHKPQLFIHNQSIFFCPGAIPPARLRFGNFPTFGQIKLGKNQNTVELSFSVYEINPQKKTLAKLFSKTIRKRAPVAK